jgi:methionine sulfoxide reductase heme-binding subunit
VSTQILWFATRGAGVVSLLLFTAVVGLGVMTSVRWQARHWPRFLTAEVHRSIALLSVVFLALHVVTAVIDPYTSLGWISALVPFASSYRPLWLGLGVVSLDLLLAVVATSLLRARIGRRAWRAIHWTAYASWPIALAHGIGTGSDASAAWMIGIDAACIFAVVTAVTWRLLAGRRSTNLPAVVASVGRGTIGTPGALR